MRIKNYALLGTIICSSFAFAEQHDKSTVKDTASVDTLGGIQNLLPYRIGAGGRFSTMFDRSGVNVGILNSAGLKMLPLDLPVNVEIIRGIAPVRAGLFGGPYTTQVELPMPMPYTEADGPLDFKAGSMQNYFDAGNHYVGTYMMQLRSKHHVGQIYYADNSWDDIDLGDGSTLLNSEADKQAIGGRYFYEGENQQFTIVCGYNEQEFVGQPAAVMDIIDGDATLCGLRHSYNFTNNTQGSLEVKYQDLEGSLSNYSMRTLSNPLSHRDTIIEGESIFAQFNFTTQLNDRRFDYGLEWTSSEVDALITAGPGAINDPVTNPRSPFLEDFFIDDYRRGFVLSGYFDATFEHKKNWLYNAGIRVIKSKTDGRANVDNIIGWHDPVITNPVAANMRILYDEYLAADREVSDTLVDVVLSATNQITPQWKIAYSFAHHNSLANVAERALFIPNWPVGAQSDGHNYIGNPELDNSKSLQFEINSSYVYNRGFYGVRAYFDDISDYIQGISIKQHGIQYYSQSPVLALNGSGNYWDDENPLQFQNIDAKIWGFDLSAGYAFTDNLSVNALAAYMRGENETHDDYLHRMLPPYISTELVYSLNKFSLSYNMVAYASQNFYSKDNQPAIVGKDLTNVNSGYAVHNLKLDWNIHPALSVSLGVENLFDRLYVDHLAPYNLIENSDIGLKDQIPGIGRNAYLKVMLRYD